MTKSKVFVPDYKVILQSQRITNSNLLGDKLLKKDLGAKAQWEEIFDWYTQPIAEQEIETQDLLILKDILIKSQGYRTSLDAIFYAPCDYGDKHLKRKYDDAKRKEIVRNRQRKAKELPHRLRKLIFRNLVEIFRYIEDPYPIFLSLTDTGIAVLIEWMKDLEKKGIYKNVLDYPSPDYFCCLKRGRDYYATKGIFWNFEQGKGWYKVEKASDSYDVLMHKKYLKLL